jgi:predicted O-methyltransferase YrrM
MTLAEIDERHCVRGPDVGHGDKGGTHSYITEYEQLLAPYREKCSFMEIGLAFGLSVAMWDEYFGPESVLTAADISIVFDKAPFPRWNFVESDATKPTFLDALGDRMFDVIIDDASHMPTDQIATRDLLLPRMNPGGLYIIEDILWLDQTRHEFEGAEIRDLRKVKGRWDDVLVIYRT